MDEAVLDFTGVEKRFGRRSAPVLVATSFSLASGELLTVRGGNGAGKSTLVRLAAGFLRPTSGRVVRRFDRFGFAPDRLVPVARLTARSYLRRLAAMGESPAVSLACAIELVDALGLQPGVDVPLALLSRGNLRKVVLAQALMRPVGLVIMDEPLSGLDEEACAAVVRVVRERLAGGQAFLVASHHASFDELGAVLELVASGPDPDAGTGAHVVLLGRPLPGRTPGRRQRGGLEYEVADSELQTFLKAALAADCEVRRVAASTERGEA